MENDAAHRVLAKALTQRGFPSDLCDIGRLVRTKSKSRVGLDGKDETLAFMVSGSSKLVAMDSDVSQQVVAFHFAGDLVSMGSAARYHYLLVAIEDCDLVVFKDADIRHLAAKHDNCLPGLLTMAIEALHRCRDNMVVLGRQAAEQRVKNFLADLSNRIGVSEQGKIILDIPMSRRDIAECLGLTVETISRQISEMRRAGLIETPSRSRIVIKDAGLGKRQAPALANAAKICGELRSINE